MPTTPGVTSAQIADQFVNLAYGNEQHFKQANDMVDDFTRTTVREGGILRLVVPPTPLKNEELDRQVDTVLPVKIVDIEPGQPPAVIASFNGLPEQWAMKTPRYRVEFSHVLTREFTINLEEMRTNHIDIRQVTMDNAIKDMQAAEDGAFINCLNAAMVAPGSTTPAGGVQWQQINSGVHRTAVVDATKILPSLNGKTGTSLMLWNNITIMDVGKWWRDESGGSISEEVMVNGYASRTILGINSLVTIKQGLVPTGSIYLFPLPNFMGKFYTLTDTTVWMERKAYLLSMFAWETLGFALGNSGGGARADFTGTY